MNDLKIRFDRSYKPPTWTDFGLTSKNCFNDYQKALEGIGAKRLLVVGGIGHTGTKTHILDILVMKTDNGLGIALGDSWASCGSQKPWSQYLYSASLDLDSVSCSKCQRSNIEHFKGVNEESLAALGVEI